MIRKILLLLLLPLVARAAVPPATSMDIYPNGARMIFEVDAAADMNFQLPGSFDINSIRAIVPAGMTVNYFQKTSVPVSDSVPDALKELYAKMKAGEAEVATIAAKIEAAKSGLGLITNLSNNTGDINADPSAYAKTLLELYSSSSVDINILSQQHREATRELQKTRELYQGRLPEGSDYITEISMGVTGQGKIKLEAFTGAASWSPSYTMNLDSKTGQVRSIFEANAYQRTGIRYSGAITFYTQTPPRGAINVPKTFPMVVDLVQERSPAPSAMAPLMRNQIMEDTIMAEPELAYAVQAPMVEESLTNFAIKGSGRLNGYGSKVSVALGETRFQGKLRTMLYRDLSREGHLVVTLEKIAEPMLPGTAELSVDGQSSGRTQIANYGRGENVEIPFGYMPLIKVNKTDNVTKTGTGGIFTSGTIQDGYTLEVVNGSAIEADIELVDRIPFPASDKITIDSIAITPTPNTNKENVLTWKMTLRPGENRKFNVGYRVKYPSDREIYYR